jgi:hypothetical protein
MAQLENEINVLRNKLASLEEQKKIEEQKEIEKLKNPLKTLESIINEKRNQIERNSHTKSGQSAIFQEKEKLTTLEPIFNMLKNISERLEVLENKK